ncbi:unnamed protein product [Vitrella brassicaformis CCMP3155]|uniref:Polyketide synthase-like methyltransferase domain-containing protein n=2 Tax=Vitrella brassicaformis TaxID=1169539 RepID=A0A0G4GBN2_VITBC|nr:unnamed protein product [Vitrella brassicaformis CCMP3155]|eukprot:CEM26539.1 unnamed protein product [Vitrella brassicaformis CCMP3155]
MDAAGFQERLINDLATSMGVLQLYLGHRLKIFDAMRSFGTETPVTASALATKMQLSERYIVEFLKSCAVQGYLIKAPNDEAAFILPAGHASALCDREHPNYCAAFTCFLPSITPILGALQEAFRTGGGMPYHDYGPDLLEGISEGNRPLYKHEMLQEWLPKTKVWDKLQTPGAKILDVACGEAWSTITLAKGLPHLTNVIDAVDLDEKSLELARQNIEAEGVSDRIALHHKYAHEVSDGDYDLIMICESLHDMHNPETVLKSLLPLLHDDGIVFVADEGVPDTEEEMLPKDPTKIGSPSDEPNNFLGRLNYGFSVLHCLPASKCWHSSAAIGTAIRPSTLRAIAKSAGYDVEEVHHNGFWRFYQLTPLAPAKSQGA